MRFLLRAKGSDFSFPTKEPPPSEVEGRSCFGKDNMKKFVCLLSLAAILLYPISALGQYSSQTAKDYLFAYADNPWSTMALAVLESESVPADYLKTINAGSAIELAAPILAITSIGQNPRTFSQEDLVAKLKTYRQNGQLGDPSTLNDDIFGLLALIAAGEPESDPARQDAKTFILAHQNANGGWGFAVTAGTDSNMTAATIVALIASGVPASDSVIQRALTYLKTAQNNDGGFTYDPQSQFGISSDSSSTAWVLWALNATGVNQSEWNKSGHTPVSYLQSNQAPGGYFQYQNGTGEDAFTAVTTAYAVIALSGKTLPINIIAGEQKFEFRIEGRNHTLCHGQALGPSALDIVKNASGQCNFDYHIQQTSFGPYLDQISEDKAEGLVGWLYLVNYESPPIGAANFILKPGDSILWYYGNYDWKPTRLFLAPAEIASAETSEVTVEYFSDYSWLPLLQAKVNFGALRLETIASGKVSLAPPDGYYQVFAEKDGFIRSNTEFLKVGNPSGHEVALKVDIRRGAIEGSTISFTVDPSTVEFGILRPGQTASKALLIHNTGNINIAVQSIVGGNDIFKDNLALNGAVWQTFMTNLANGGSKEINAALAIPANYSGSEGEKTGSITFWAMAQ